MTRATASYAGARALVLGGSGFIGRWMARALSDAGADLVVSGRDGGAVRAALNSLNVQAEVVPATLHESADVRALLADCRPSVVFNLAGYGVDRSERDDGQLLLVNRDLVHWLAEALAGQRQQEWPGPTLVHVGSALEYGAVGGNLAEVVEGRPTEAYGRSKLAGTVALDSVARRTGLRAVTARLFTVYGPGEHETRLLPSLVRAAESGGSVALSSGTQRRDFTYVADAAEGLLRLGAAASLTDSLVNVTTGRISTVRQFAETAARVLGLEGSRLRFGALPDRPEEMLHDRVATERMRRATGWVPGTTIAVGVERAVALSGVGTGPVPSASPAGPRH